MSRSQLTQYINQGVPARWAIGEDVTTSICGTTNDCILRFDTEVSTGNGIVAVTTAAAGTAVNITYPGVYHCSLTYIPTAGGTINHIGISMNTDAAALVADPGMATTGPPAAAALRSATCVRGTSAGRSYRTGRP